MPRFTASAHTFTRGTVHARSARRQWRAIALSLAIFGGLIPSIASRVSNPAPASAADNYQTAVQADAPVSYWRLDETSGTTAVDQQNRNNGAIQGGVSLNQTGLLNPSVSTDTAMSFDGSTGWIQLTPTASLEPSTLTWEAWVQTTDPLANTKAISRLRCNQAPDCGYTFGLPAASTGAGVVFGTWDSTGTVHACLGGPLLNDGKPHHVAGAKDSAHLYVYVDGALVQVCANTAPTFYGTVTGAGIARDADDPNSIYYWNGKLDEIALYNTALTPSQVANHYLASGNVLAPRGPAITAAEVSAAGNFCWTCYAKRTVHGSRADPVNTATGGFFESAADLASPDAASPSASPGRTARCGPRSTARSALAGRTATPCHSARTRQLAR